jgi:hypothetical protein
MTMAPRSRAWHILQTAKQEALLAVDLYNRANRDRSLEGFIVHMSIAWLYLCHAIFTQKGVDFRYWEKVDGRKRLKRENGEPLTWDLRRCLRELYSDENDPVRRNVEFFIAFRNMIEHRHARMAEPVVAGRAQSLILNFESKLTAEFGTTEGLGSSLRLPIFLSSLTEDAQAAVKKAYKLLPVRLTNFIAAYDAALPEEIRNHPHYEFRLYLLPQQGPKSQADAALRFVRLEDYTDAERERIEQGLVVVRNRDAGTPLSDYYRATEVAKAVQERIPWTFNVFAHHTPAWQFFKIRCKEGDDDPTKTDRRYCEYIRALGQWVYTKAWIDLLVKELESEARFAEVTGRKPVPRPAAEPMAPIA